MKFRKNGFTLVELMVALGISSVVAFFGASVMVEQYTNQAYLETMSEIDRMAMTVQNTLRNKEQCDFNMSSYNQGTVFPPSDEIEAIWVRNPTTGVVSKIVETKSYGNFDLKTIQIHNSPVNPRVKNFELTFSYPHRKFLKNADIKKTISILAEVDAGDDGIFQSTDIWKCGSVIRDVLVESQQSLCNALGTNFTAWNSATNNCDLKAFICPPGEAASGLLSLGSPNCVPVESVLLLDGLTDLNPVPCPATNDNIRIEFSSGMFRLVCN